MSLHIDRDFVRGLIDLVAEEQIAELHASGPNGSVRLVRHFGGGSADPTPSTPQGADAGDRAGPAGAPAAHTVTAPMTGTFHRATSPGAESLVSEGSRVARGTPLGVIEAMKMINEVVADRSGTVVKVLCREAQAVEQGQALFTIAVDGDGHVS